MTHPPALPYFNVAFQYVRRVGFETHLRPYEVRDALRQHVTLSVTTQALKHPGHHRVVLLVSVKGTLADNRLVTNALAEVEAIVSIAPGLDDETVQSLLRVESVAVLFAQVRNLLATVSLGAGFPVISLPLITGAALANIPHTALPAEAPDSPEPAPASAPEGNA